MSSSDENSEKHAIKREFPCNICDRVLHSKSAYHLHKKVKHSDGPLRYICDCGKSFQMKMSYETHLRVHTKVKKDAINLIFPYFNQSHI